jgi:hypothetical protein
VVCANGFDAAIDVHLRQSQSSAAHPVAIGGNRRIYQRHEDSSGDETEHETYRKHTVGVFRRDRQDHDQNDLVIQIKWISQITERAVDTAAAGYRGEGQRCHHA